MKTLVLFLAATMCCGTLAATDVSGNQSGLWDLANSPYNIIGDITVPAGSSLNIEPGVQVFAMGDYRITAQGFIYALGTEADSIRFMSGQADPNALWKGIRLESTTQGSHLGFCYIEKAEYGVNSINSPTLIHHCRFNLNQKGMQLYGIGAADPAEVIVSTNIIERSIQNGILVAQNSNAVILANELRFNGTGTQYMAAIQLSNQSAGGSNSPEISTNWIHHNFKQGITAWDIVGASAINPQIHDNLIEYNLTGIYLLNASGYVFDNIIRHNFIAGDANSGAGVMVAGA
ncbi:MAG TPA: right-handed parallel beta-helix repeat-containing protein, partial [Candidatus Syntrophosphaera sp.]|nr:right-handed parallel beta-helix repeat-containing protein [Candidatus Syntrophosphaera sp.]